MVRKESYLVHEAWGDHQLKKDEARGLGMKTVTGRERSVCFAQVVPVMHAAELLEVCTTWKGNKDTHTAKNGYDGHTGDLECSEMDRAGLEVARGSGTTVTSVGAALSPEGAVRLYEIVTPARNTAGKRHQGSQTRAGGKRAQTGSDHSSLEWRAWAEPG